MCMTPLAKTQGKNLRTNKTYDTLLTGVQVKNLIGTTDNPRPDGYKDKSWIEFWEDNSGKKATSCKNIECKKKETLLTGSSEIIGGHIKKSHPNNTDHSHYIVPICKTCNSLTDDFNVNSTDLIPVNQNKT